ncbi:hypothetical protein DFH06DRAFT_1127845 [Mycena polygramma]|nr:hypothetical protein DFH06DRAFT_1127845 [Mycena polygramma]
MNINTVHTGQDWACHERRYQGCPEGLTITKVTEPIRIWTSTMSSPPSTKPLTCKVCRQRKVKTSSAVTAKSRLVDLARAGGNHLLVNIWIPPCLLPQSCLKEPPVSLVAAMYSGKGNGHAKIQPSQMHANIEGKYSVGGLLTKTILSRSKSLPLKKSTYLLIPDPVKISIEPLNFPYRNLFLQQSWEYGLHISAEKRAAIARSDPSSTVVHPALIAVSELHGYTLAKNSGSATYAYLKGHWDTREAAQLARVLSLLDAPTDRRAPDPLTCVQVYKLLALYYLRQKKGFRGYAEYLGQASDIALRHQALLGLDESAPAPPAPIGSAFPLGAVEEGRSTLAHLVYLEVAVGIIRKIPPLLPAAMIAKFERFAESVAGETELNFVRAKTVIYLQESEKLVDEWNTDEAGGIVGSEWADRWIAISKRLHAHLFTLRTAIAEHLSVHHVAVLILKSCVVITLASMAILHAVFVLLFGTSHPSRRLRPGTHTRRMPKTVLFSLKRTV